MSKSIDKAIETIIFVICSMMVLFLFGQVVLRSLFDYALQWADEFTRFGMIWTTFLGAALVVKDRGHTRVEYFLRFLPSNVNRYVNILLNVLLCVFLSILIFNSTSTISESMKQITPGLGIPYGMVMIALPVGGVLMIVYLLSDCVRLLKERGGV